jgi:hypothetical protein
MMRATDVGHPPLDGIMGQVADAVKRWEMRRGIRPVESWFEVHRKRVEQRKAVKRTRGTPEQRATWRAKSQARLTAADEAQAAAVLANPEAYTPIQVARTKIEQARRQGGEAAVRKVRAELRAAADARAAAKRKAKAEAIRAEKLTRLDTLNTLSRVRTLIEEARRTGGDEAADALRAQFKRERYERKRRQQTERYQQKKLKLGSKTTERKA